MESRDKQMELFADGGLMDEGGMVDEVSGNEVPPGSTREEVRDDIPAQLSEGEFVFPADVVRYFGLEKLMEMRQEAKMGLKRMEEMGQMGNSDEATMPDDLPFTIDDLDIEEEDEYNEVQEFAVGGAVQMPGFTGIGGYVQPPATTTSVAPAPVAAASAPVTAYKPPQQAFTPVLNVPQTIPTFQGVVGFGPEGVEYETVTYVNEAGQTIVLKKNKQTGQLLDMAGNPTTVPEGYKLKGEEDAVKTESTVPTTTVGQDEDRGGDGDNGGLSSRVGTTLGTNPAIGVSVPTGGAVSQADRNAFGGNVNAIDHAGYRSAVAELAGYQFGMTGVGAMVNPTLGIGQQMAGAFANTDIGKSLGLPDIGIGALNAKSTAMNQARNSALNALGLANMSQVTTAAQYDVIAEAMKAGSKGTSVSQAIAGHPEAIKAGQVAAMTELGYKSTDIDSPVAVAQAMASYDTQIDQLSGEIDATTQSGAVKSELTNEPVRDKDLNPVMQEKELAKVNNLKEILAAKKAKKGSLLSTELGKAAAVSAAFDAAGYNEDDDPGQNAPSGGYTGNVSEDPGFDSGFSDGSRGSDNAGSDGVGPAGGDESSPGAGDANDE